MVKSTQIGPIRLTDANNSEHNQHYLLSWRTYYVYVFHSLHNALMNFLCKSHLLLSWPQVQSWLILKLHLQMSCGIRRWVAVNDTCSFWGLWITISSAHLTGKNDIVYIFTIKKLAKKNLIRLQIIIHLVLTWKFYYVVIIKWLSGLA